MKGLEELAKACAPEEVAPEGAGRELQLSEELIDKIADRMISKLQAPAPEKEEPAPEDEDPEEDPEEGEEDAD